MHCYDAQAKVVHRWPCRVCCWHQEERLIHGYAGLTWLRPQELRATCSTAAIYNTTQHNMCAVGSAV